LGKILEITRFGTTFLSLSNLFHKVAIQEYFNSRGSINYNLRLLNGFPEVGVASGS
jgi:hypothetical protein